MNITFGVGWERDLSELSELDLREYLLDCMSFDGKVESSDLVNNHDGTVLLTVDELISDIVRTHVVEYRIVNPDPHQLSYTITEEPC